MIVEPTCFNIIFRALFWELVFLLPKFSNIDHMALLSSHAYLLSSLSQFL